MKHDLGELPSPGMSVFDMCPRAQKQWLENLLRDYGNKVREHDAKKKGSWEQVLGHLGTPDEVGNLIYCLKGGLFNDPGLPSGAPESDYFILENAMQRGFEMVDDNGDVFNVSARNLVAFVKLYMGPPMITPPPTSLTAQGHDGLYVLRRIDTGLPVAVNDIVSNFRHEFTALRSGEAPHKDTSEGYVTTDLGRYYAGVFGLRWVKADA